MEQKAVTDTFQPIRKLWRDCKYPSLLGHKTIILLVVVLEQIEPF